VAIAHRGEHFSHPENTLAAYAAAADAGADYVEIDVRTTRDGKLVIHHDPTVDRMTGGHGNVKEMTLAELQRLTVQGEKLPSFDDVLEFARNRVGLYVDVKDAAVRDLIDAIENRGMSHRVAIYGPFDLLLEISRLRPEILLLPEAFNPPHVKKIAAAWKPRVIAFDARDFFDETIAAALAAKAEIWVDRLGALDQPRFWQDAVDRGAAGIQTDRPAALVQFLRSRR
jgi:glycerophosphoryl diester phosphodiesterase